MSKKILLLSGTSEGPLLARALLEEGFTLVATVTTESGRKHLFGQIQDPRLRIDVRGFTPRSLELFLQAEKIDMVLDATHPFAVRITQIAHAVCEKLPIPYVRYERADWDPPEGTIYADTFQEAATLLPSLGRRVMFTIGAKQLKHFAHLHDRLTLFARILPGPASLQKAREAGFPVERILCLRPPFSREANQKLFREYRIDVLVTKASGVEGGVVEKVLAAFDFGLQVLMIRRPKSALLSPVSTVDEVIELCKRAKDTRKVEDPGAEGL